MRPDIIMSDTRIRYLAKNVISIHHYKNERPSRASWPIGWRWFPFQ